MKAATRSRERYAGQIAGVGTESGTRLVVGRWSLTPYGPFADVMVERPDGHRILFAPHADARRVIESTYVFDEVRLGPVDVSETPDGWVVTAPSLRLTFTIGPRPLLGILLRRIPTRVATSTWWATLVDPVASRVMDGVRTRGTARPGRTEWYGATDLHLVTAVTATLDGQDLGRLTPVEPPCRFGFSSTPRTPSVTRVVTTIESSD